MSHQIKKERIHLFSPSANISIVSVLDKIVEKETLCNAIEQAIDSHEILCSKIHIQEDGTATFEKSNTKTNTVLSEFHSESLAVIKEQAEVPFDIQQGETIRFFYSYKNNQTELLVIAHHIVGDGRSLIIFMDDLLQALNSQSNSYKPLQTMSHEHLPKHKKLNPFMRIMIKHTNLQWKKRGKVFTFSEFKQMFEQFHSTYNPQLFLKQIHQPELSTLKDIARQNNITLNSLLITALACVIKDSEKIGLAVDMRPESFIGMGNYSSGISIDALYNTSISFLENAKNIHTLIYQKLNHKGDRYFLFEFMGSLPPTLIDSLCFSQLGLYQNPIASSMSKMCGYIKNPTGTSTTNLAEIKLSENPNWDYHYSSLFFIPPYISNVHRIVGISTYNDTLTLTSQVVSDNNDEQSVLDSICANLTNLISTAI